MVGRLLLTLAGFAAATDANLPAMVRPWRSRAAVHAAALRHIDVLPPKCAADGEATGRAGELARIPAEMVAHLGETVMLRGLAQHLQELLAQEVHPQSPLQGLLGTARLLERPRSAAPLEDGGGQPLSPAQELAAWEQLWQVQPPPTLVELLLPRFQSLRASHPGLEGMTSVAARLHAAANDRVARDLATAWIVEHPDDPAARLCRLRADLVAGDVAVALDDAMSAVQLGLDRTASIRAVCALCTAVQIDAPAAARGPIEALRAAFAELGP